MKWTARGPGGAIGAAKRAWAQGNPCYLCGEFGHRAKDHKEMPRGPWPAEDAHPLSLHQKKWGEIRDLVDSGFTREQVAAQLGVTMTDAAASNHEEYFSLLLARYAGVPDWSTGEAPRYAKPNAIPDANQAFQIQQTPGMQRSRAWCGTPPILGVVNMVGTRNFTCYKGAL